MGVKVDRCIYAAAIAILLFFAYPVAAQKSNTGNGAQDSSIYTYGIDEQRDSIAFAKFRLHMDSIRVHRPTVALVLSGGGAKGAAHIPVIQFLEETGIPIDIVLGTSIGSLVGGLYACGYNGQQLEEIIRSQDWDYLMRDTHPRKFSPLIQKDFDNRHQIKIPFGQYRWNLPNLSKMGKRAILRDGIITGRNVEDLFASLLPGYSQECDFLQLPTPFICVASDMVSAKSKLWHSGNLISAMRSSMAIPGYFTPVHTNGMVLLDGFMRNNFPANIASELGADIIIGVDISTPALKASEMKSMIDVIFQATDIMARDAYVAGIESSNIYIQPELSDFNILSFDTASIDVIIQRGREAVMKHADKIRQLKQEKFSSDNESQHINSKKPIDISKQSVSIAEVRFEGIDADEENYVIKLLDLPHFVTKKDLDDAIATLMGTKAFEKVTYQLLGEKAPYTLQFNFFRSPVNILGAGFRFDTKDYAALIVSLGINACKLTGSWIDLTARLGLMNKISLTYTKRTAKSTNFGGDISFQAVRNGEFRLNSNNFRVDFDRTNANVFLSISPAKRANIKIGAAADYFSRHTLLSDYSLSGTPFNMSMQDNIYLNAFVSLRSDSFDDPYFPTKGLQYNINYNWNIVELMHDLPQIHAVQLAFRPAFSIGIMTLLPYVEGRWVSESVFPYTNMLAVSNANRIIDQQIPFIGISTPVFMRETLGTAGLNMRVHIAKSHYVTASIQVLHDAANIKDFIDPEASDSNYGMALEYAYSTLVGPIRAKVHWSNLTNTVGLYISMGFDF